MSESIEMAAVPDSYNQDSCLITETDLASSSLGEPDKTIRNEEGQEEKTPDAGSLEAAAQDACSETKTEGGNVNTAVNEQRQNAGQISTCAHYIFVLFGSIIMVLMIGLAVYLVFRLLK
eukprot:scpid104386/ scgid7484/ 